MEGLGKNRRRPPKRAFSPAQLLLLHGPDAAARCCCLLSPMLKLAVPCTLAPCLATQVGNISPWFIGAFITPLVLMLAVNLLLMYHGVDEATYR